MMKERIVRCITSIVKSSDEIEADIDINVYGLDSLLKVELVIALEDEFNISFNDDDLNQKNFDTVNTIMKLLVGYGVN